jgi:hypothetical protein
LAMLRLHHDVTISVSASARGFTESFHGDDALGRPENPIDSSNCFIVTYAVCRF